MRVWHDFVRHHIVIQAKRARLRQARTVTLGGGPKQYDTALTSEEEPWARKGWAGKWHPNDTPKPRSLDTNSGHYPQSARLRISAKQVGAQVAPTCSSGSRDWIRTNNRPINSRMLCR